MLTFFIRRPRFAMVIALLLTFVGAVSLKLIPVEQYPAITPPVVNVSASWPGASASDVAEAIAAPLETQLNGVDHMLYMESTSSDEGTYRLSITFAAGTDADLAAIDVQNRVAQALAQRGCHLALADRNQEGLAETAALPKLNSVKVSLHTLDVADRDAVAARYREAIKVLLA